MAGLLCSDEENEALTHYETIVLTMVRYFQAFDAVKIATSAGQTFGIAFIWMN